MTWNHVIYIPMAMIVGVFLGFIFGARAAKNSFDLQRKRDEERAIAKAAREQRKKEREADTSRSP